MVNLAEIKKFFKGEIRINESMHEHTTLRIGGPADVFFLPADKDDIIRLFLYHHENKVPFYILGHGSNILVGDKGIRHSVVAIKDTLSYLRVKDEKITVGAGYNMPRFVLECLRNGYEGIEGLGGIPGTVGGAVIMNAGAYGAEIFNFIRSVELIREGNHIVLPREQIRYGYRDSGLKGSVILEITVELPASRDIHAALEKRKELLKKRNLSQPLDKANAGSFFKNPAGKYAAELIEKCGLKGKRIGNAAVSEKHANFLINLGDAKALEMLALADLVRKEVSKNFDIELEMEVQKVGEF